MEVKYEIVKNLTDEEKESERLLELFKTKDMALIALDENKNNYLESLRYAVGFAGGITHRRETIRYYDKIKELINAKNIQ